MSREIALILIDAVDVFSSTARRIKTDMVFRCLTVPLGGAGIPSIKEL